MSAKTRRSSRHYSIGRREHDIGSLRACLALRVRPQRLLPKAQDQVSWEGHRRRGFANTHQSTVRRMIAFAPVMVHALALLIIALTA